MRTTGKMLISIWSKARDGNPLLYLFSKLWHYSAGNKKYVTLFWTMFIIAELSELLIGPFILARIMNVIQTEGINNQNILNLFILLLCYFIQDVVFWGFHGPGRVLERINAFKARANYRGSLLSGVMALPMEWHVENHSGNTIDKIEKGTTALYEFAEDTFEIIYALVRLVGSYVVLAWFSPPAAIIVLVMMSLMAWVTIRFDKKLLEQYLILNKSENNIQESVFDSISNIATIIILRVERLIFRAIMHKVENPLQLFKSNVRLAELKWFFTSMFCRAMIVLVLAAYFYQNLGAKQGVLVGSLYLLIMYLDKLGDLFFEFTSKYGDIVRRRAKVANSELLSDCFKEVDLTDHVLPDQWNLLEIKDLSFSYDTAENKLQLKNISLTLQRNLKYAVIGESGGGKTTFLNVFRDIFHPQNLTLKVDGQPVQEGFAGISRAIGYAPQSPELFADTIWKNITMGAEYDELMVRRYTDMAMFTSVIEALPNKFESSINEKGVNLSGGQRQRLALARALIACHDADKTILLFDEPTSSLDSQTEMKVINNIFRAFPDRTHVFSLHRLHLLRQFDWIFFFDDGKIIASGTFDDMLKNCDQFKSMWALYNAQQTHTVS